MAVFITGGFGHIGSWMARHFALKNKKVVLYDVKERKLDYLKECLPNIRYIKGSVLDLPGLEKALSSVEEGIEGIVHTVGIMGELVLGDPYTNSLVNINGTLGVLEAARKRKIKKIVYTSTGAVYGALSGTARELEHPPNPADLYSATKTSSEFLGLRYADAFGMDFRAGRVYFVYGPGKRPSQFINLYRLVFGALEGLTGLSSDKGGDQRLDFIHVEDAAKGLCLLFEAEKPAYKIYNLATGVPVSLAEAADLAYRYSKIKKEKAVFGPGVLMQRCEALDSSLARAEFGFNTSWSLEKGIENYALWMEKNPLF